MAHPVDPRALEKIAEVALSEVRDGMTLGLGTGRAAEAFIRRLGEARLGVRGVPTSERSHALASEVGVVLTTLDEVERLDVAFDGADEVTADLSLTKGLGGALLRERVVAHAAARFVVMVTAEKVVPRLGTRNPIPIEVVSFARVPVSRELARLGGTPVVRTRADGSVYLTDNGNPILDTTFAPIEDPVALDQAMRRIPGLVDTGLFLGMADLVLVGEGDQVKTLTR